VFGGVMWERCQFHLQQNAQAYIPKEGMKKEVARDIRAIFNAPNRTEAEGLLARTVTKYAKTASKLSSWMEENLPEGFAVFAHPETHRKRLRTSNGIERGVNQEIVRRTHSVRIFPNAGECPKGRGPGPGSCLRLVTALVMEFSEEGEVGRAYLPQVEVE